MIITKIIKSCTFNKRDNGVELQKFQWASFDCKSGLSLAEPRYENWLVARWPKKTKKIWKIFLKKSSEKEFIFFIVNFPMRPELFILLPFVYWELQNVSYFGLKCNNNFKKYPNLK